MTTLDDALKSLGTYVDIDEVAVDGALWLRVKAGDPNARAFLQAELAGLVVYSHALGTRDEDVLVTLRELEQAGIIESVMITATKERRGS